MSGKHNRYIGFWQKFFKVLGFVKTKDELSITQEWARIDADPNIGKTPRLVDYKYHRYFYKATDGKGVRHIMAHAILN